MPGFRSYQTTDDGLVRMQRDDGTFLPGVLPGVAAPYMAGLSPYQPPAPTPAIEVTAPVDAGMVAALPPRPSATGETALADNGVMVMPADEVKSQPVGLAAIATPRIRPDAPVGLAAIAPTANRVPDAYDELGHVGEQLADATRGHGASTKPALVPVVPAAAGAAGARPGYVTPSDAGAGGSREAAARAWEDVAKEAGRSVPGVYDPGGPRMLGYTTQRQNGTSTAALREADRAAEQNLPPEVLARSNARLDELRATIPVLTAAIRKEKSPSKQAAGRGELASLLGEYGRLTKALSTVRDQLPPDQAALADLEGKEKRRGALDQQAATIDAEQAERQTRAAFDRETMANRHASEVSAFHERRTAALDGLYADLDAKRKQYENAEVDPGRLFADAGTGRQIAAGVFAALGGVGQAILGDRGPNQSLGVITSAIDKDIQLQLEGIKKKGAELGQLAQQYQFAKDKFGTEEAGMAAAHLAALEGVSAKVDRMAAEAGTEKAKLGAERLRAGLQEQIALRRFQLEQGSKGSIAEQVQIVQPGVRGGHAPNYKARAEALDKAGEARGKTADDNRANAAELAKGSDKVAKPQQGLFINGQFAPAHPGAQPEVLKDAQQRVTYADSLLSDVEAVRKRMGEPGAYAPGDPQAAVDAQLLSKSLSRAASNEAASESDKKDVHDAVTPGPRQAAALARLEQKAREFKADAARSVGVGVTP